MGLNSMRLRLLVRGSVLMLCLLFTAPVYAQTWKEWMRQKRTQERYLWQQLAYLRLYADQAWKGYRLVDGGLETVRKFTSGEFSLHGAFISALSTVSPWVRNDVRLAEILQYQLEIAAGFRELMNNSALSGGTNLAYYRQVREGLMSECSADLEELLEVVLSSGLEMNDAQRLGRLKKIHGVMAEKASFVRWFCAEAALLSQGEKKELLDLENLGRWYEKEK